MVTRIGGPGDDQLFGTERADLLDGLAGDDRLYALAGRDLLRGDDGDDWLYGGEGNDRLYGAFGNDYLDGGPDADLLDGGEGRDGAGWTELTATQQVFADLADGMARVWDATTGTDTFDTLRGIETLKAGAGMDTLGGDAGVNRLYGHRGGDELLGRGGNDYLDGGPGGDGLDGGTGNDRLLGGDDGDLLHWDPGIDLLDGGAGTDRVVMWTDGAPPPHDRVVADLIDGTLTSGGETDWIVAVEDMSGTPLADRIYGDDGPNVLEARGSPAGTQDTVYGRRGDDQISGSGYLNGGAGNDLLVDGLVLDGRAGDDVLRSGSGQSHVTGGSGADRFAYAFGSSGEGGNLDGASLVLDFRHGERDLIDVFFFASEPGDPSYSSQDLFPYWDRNADGVLGSGDQFVALRNLTVDGVTALSTVIDLGASHDALYERTGTSFVLQLYGATGLTLEDFG